MLNLILNHPGEYPLHAVIHAKLSTDFPFIEKVMGEVKQMCEERDIAYLEATPTHSWDEFYQKHGYPTRKARWCNTWKLSGLNNAIERVKESYADEPEGLHIIRYIGICANETRRIKQSNRYRYPLVEFGIEEDTILEWAKTNPVFDGFYKFNTRCGCMMCPMASLPNWAYTKLFYPKEFAHYTTLAERYEQRLSASLGRPFSVWSSNPKYDTAYRKKIVEEKYLPRLLAVLEEAQNEH